MDLKCWSWLTRSLSPTENLTDSITSIATTSTMMRNLLQTALLFSVLGSSTANGHEQVLLSTDYPLVKTRPNIVFILTDDQDLHMDSLSFMPHLQKHLVDEGTFYPRHYCTIALCCPSRVSLWTGKAAHNTNVTDVNPPYGEFNWTLK